MTAILETRHLEKTFGSVTAAADINVAVEENEVVGLIGANGAGKTTFVNMVTGYVPPSAGHIVYAGRDITALGPRQVTNLGIARSFQVPQVFLSATVFDNVLIAMGVAARDRLLFWRPLRRPELVESARDSLRRFHIAAYADQPAGELPQGVRKLLDIAMAVVHRPRVLLLDEPTSGVSVEEKFAIMDTVMEALRAGGVTVLFVEHDMEIIGRYAQRVWAFYEGRIIADAPPAEALAVPRVQQYVIGETLHRPGGPAAGGEGGHA